MSICFDTRKENYNNIKAGTHLYDLTVRPQLLKRKTNEKYYDLIYKFYKMTGIPVCKLGDINK